MGHFQQSVAAAILLGLTAATPLLGQESAPSPEPSPEASPSPAADGRPRLELTRTTAPPAIDGLLDDQAWQGPPLPLTDWITYNPLSGEKLAQTTEVWATYDDANLYFAFRCVDPEPDRVRAVLSRRDQLFNDDWVGLSLDGVGARQSSYDMFVNAAGVQGDILTTTSAGENLAPDWIWQSAGQRTKEGYSVEVRLPLKSIRFKSGSEVRMGVMFWRRVSRLGISASWPSILPGKSVMDQHATLVLHDLKQPLLLELIPSVTYSWNQDRATPDRFDAADSEPDAGLSVKYGLSSAVTVEGTVNPDFSQVESDAFQVEVNQRFPIFFSEKRPFFMEGMGTFEMAGVNGDANMRTSVHTRRIFDPIWGGKVSGTLGKVTFAALSASDEAPGRSENGTPNPFLGDNKYFHVARGLYGLGGTNYIGGLFTDAEFASGHNRVAGVDASFRRSHHQLAAMALGSQSAAPDGTGRKDGLAGHVLYIHDTKRLLLINQVEHYDRDFQMDTAFYNQTGITTNWSFAALSLYPDAKKYPWLKRVVPFVFTRFGRDRVQGGDIRFVLPGIRIHTTKQGFFRVDAGFGREPWAQRSFRTSIVRLIAEAQFTKWFRAFGMALGGRGIFYDPVDPYPGNHRTYVLNVGLQPSSRLNQSVEYTRVKFDRLDGTRVFTVDVVNTKTTYQFDKHFFLRGIVQYDSSRDRVLTDFLGSFELLPGTVVYAGYGSLLEQREWDGLQWQMGRGDYLTTRRGFFFKASYAHRF